MKVLAIMGSPHGMKGNTGKLLKPAIESAQKAGASVSTMCLADYTVRPCCGCGQCHKVGTCPLTDDFAKFSEAMSAADGILLASPNYVFSVSAQTKALLDRSTGPLHCQAFEGKYAAAVVTSGGEGAEEVERYMLRFMRAMGCWTVGSVSAQGWQLMRDDMSGPLLEASADLGARLVEAIRTKATFPEQADERRRFYERMKQIVSAQKNEWKFEYEYWKSKGRM